MLTFGAAEAAEALALSQAGRRAGVHQMIGLQDHVRVRVNGFPYARLVRPRPVPATTRRGRAPLAWTSTAKVYYSRGMATTPPMPNRCSSMAAMPSTARATSRIRPPCVARLRASASDECREALRW